MKESHLPYISIIAVVVIVAGVVFFQGQNLPGKELTPTGGAVLRQNGASCSDNSQCQSYLCGTDSWSPLTKVCTARGSKDIGETCGKQDDNPELGTVGNDYECSLGICGVNTITPFTMACEWNKRGQVGDPCGRDEECLGVCSRLPGRFVGQCA